MILNIIMHFDNTVLNERGRGGGVRLNSLWFPGGAVGQCIQILLGLQGRTKFG